MGITEVSQCSRRRLIVAVFVILILTIVFISLILYFQLKETPCEHEPCHNDGTCIEVGESFNCECPIGYNGTKCEETPCSNQPCLNNGSSEINGASNFCFCRDGYNETMCEELEFKPIFVACSGNGQSVLDTWRTPSKGREFVNINESCTSGHLRSSIIDNWNGSSIDQVKVELFTNGKLDLGIYFDGNLSTSSNWFSKERILSSTFNDLTQSSTVNFFSLNGDQTVDRHFYISNIYSGCPGDLFWIVIIDTADANYRPCDYDKLPGKEYPYILYAPNQHKTTLNDGTYAVAEKMVISILTFI